MARWTPPKEMILRQPEARKYAGGMPEGPKSARRPHALSLSERRLHALHDLQHQLAQSIGTGVTSGTTGLLSQDMIDLYSRTPVGQRWCPAGGQGRQPRPRRRCGQRKNGPFRKSPSDLECAAVTCRVAAPRRFERPLPICFPQKRTDWNWPLYAAAVCGQKATFWQWIGVASNVSTAHFICCVSTRSWKTRQRTARRQACPP